SDSEGGSKEQPSWGKGEGKSYVIPVIEIFGFEFLLNQYNRRYSREKVYDTNFDTLELNLHSGWVIDHDPFATNQLLHPYQGSIYMGIARSSGLNFWESSLYTLGGGFVWEPAGEKQQPPLHAQNATTL